MTEHVPLRWVKNDVDGAKYAFGPGRVTPEFTYLGAPIKADFDLTYENLAPYVTEVLDLAEPFEGMVGRVEIRGGKVNILPL